MKHSRWLLLGLFLPVLAFAHGGVDDAKRSVQMSMLVTGEIAVNPDGSVYGYSLDHRDKLPVAVIKLIDETLPHWKFTSVQANGKPVLAKALMSLRIVAHQATPGHFVATVQGAAFGDDAVQSTDSCAPGACLAYATRQPPVYPLAPLRDGVGGTVYVVVEVNRKGHVANAAVWQVNLRRMADATELVRWRQDFARVTLDAARHWTFNVPTTGNEARQDHWFVTVPVKYSPYGQYSAPGYGQWDPYVPGPIQPLPWAKSGAEAIAAGGSADATPDDGKPFVVDPRFVLLTPLVKDGARNDTGNVGG